MSCDAVTIRDPDGSERPLLLLNKNSTSLETRKRFTISHEIGHLKIPWHCGSIACHIDEGEASVSGDHYSLEGEAHRFASELLMPTEWVKRVIAEASSIEKIYERVLNTANVSRTAVRIKLMKTLPPGSYVSITIQPQAKSCGSMNPVEGSCHCSSSRATGRLSRGYPRRWSSMRSMGMNSAMASIGCAGGSSTPVVLPRELT